MFADPALDPAPGRGGGFGGLGPPDDEGPGTPSRSWQQRAIIGVGIFLVMSCLVGTLVAGWVLRTYNSIGRVDDLELNTVAAGEPKNYLIVGSDSRAGENGEYGSTTGQRSDSIMVLRVDPASEQAWVLSFPRDLRVQIAGTTGSTQKINSAYSGDSANPDRLIETLRLNFGIPIHHYVEIDFEGFKKLIDHIGGIDLWFSNAVRNLPGKYDVGLDIHELGCVHVDATQALALARSRVLQYRGPDGWVTDPTSDYGRMTRQQIVIRQALKKAAKQAKDSPLQAKGLIELAAGSVVLDDTIDIGDMLDLGEKFKDFDPTKLLTFSLPTYTTDAEGKTDPLPDKPKAEPLLNVFRGLPINEVGPSLVKLTVKNGSGKEGQAANVAGAFQKIGFQVKEPTTSEPAATTTVLHAPGQESYGLRVARHLTAPAQVQASEDLSPGEVVLITGADFTTVHEEPTPIDKMPTSTVPPAAGGSATTASTTATTAASTATTATTVQAPPPTTPQVGYTAGQPPPGKECG